MTKKHNFGRDFAPLIPNLFSQIFLQVYLYLYVAIVPQAIILCNYKEN